MTTDRLTEIFAAAKPGDNLKKILAPHFEFGPALLEHLLLSAGLAGNVKRKDVDVEGVAGQLLEVLNGGHAFVKSREAKGYIVQGCKDMYTYYFSSSLVQAQSNTHTVESGYSDNF